MRVLTLLTIISGGHGCWFTSKTDALKHITNYMNTHGHPMDHGLTRKDFTDIVEDMPASLSWIVRKVGGINAVMTKCDTDDDGTVYIPEAKAAKHCLTDCWKQSAILTFLN